MQNTYRCSLCKKYYKTEITLNKHIKLIHESRVCEDEKSFCEYCKKEFLSSKNMKRHSDTCKVKKQIIAKLAEENEKLKNDMIKKENDMIKKEEEFKQDMAELKKMVSELLNKNCKMHYKTLQKINNSAGRDLNNGVINNNTINIMALGHENIDEVLTKTDKLTILNKKENALPYMIELVHFNDKFPQFKNIAITNMRTTFAHVYDPDNKVFKMVDKDELVEELIDYRVCDIEDYYLQYKNELDKPVRDKIEELIEHRGENEATKGKIKLLLFNNRHKIEV
jgi:hypothetical protein